MRMLQIIKRISITQKEIEGPTSLSSFFCFIRSSFSLCFAYFFPRSAYTLGLGTVVLGFMCRPHFCLHSRGRSTELLMQVAYAASQRQRLAVCAVLMTAKVWTEMSLLDCGISRRIHTIIRQLSLLTQPHGRIDAIAKKPRIKTLFLSEVGSNSLNYSPLRITITFLCMVRWGFSFVIMKQGQLSWNHRMLTHDSDQANWSLTEEEKNWSSVEFKGGVFVCQDSPRARPELKMTKFDWDKASWLVNQNYVIHQLQDQDCVFNPIKETFPPVLLFYNLRLIDLDDDPMSMIF